MSLRSFPYDFHLALLGMAKHMIKSLFHICSLLHIKSTVSILIVRDFGQFLGSAEAASKSKLARISRPTGTWV